MRKTRILILVMFVLAATASLHTPANAAVVISNDPTMNMVCTNGVCSPTSQDAVLNTGDLQTLLGSGAVTVTTTGSNVQASDIDVMSKFGWSTASSLGLDAYSSIAISAPISAEASGGINLTTNDGGSGGVLWFAQKGRIGLTTEQLQSGLPTGFDPSIWTENPNINNGLPYLISNPPQ